MSFYQSDQELSRLNHCSEKCVVRQMFGSIQIKQVFKCPSSDIVSLISPTTALAPYSWNSRASLPTELWFEHRRRILWKLNRSQNLLSHNGTQPPEESESSLTVQAKLESHQKLGEIMDLNQSLIKEQEILLGRPFSVSWIIEAFDPLNESSSAISWRNRGGDESRARFTANSIQDLKKRTLAPGSRSCYSFKKQRLWVQAYWQYRGYESFQRVL